MEPVRFTHDMIKTRQLILWCTLLLLILALAAGLMISLGNRSLLGIIEIITAIGVVAFLLTLVFLWLAYASRSEVKDKRQLLGKLKKADKDLLNAQSALSKALEKEESFRQKSKNEQATLHQTLEAQEKEFETRGQQLKTAQQEELVQTLARLQANHIEAGLKANQLDPTDIPGVGEVLLQKLNAAGIHTAFDVTSQAIQATTGFGESKTLSLVRWRESVERSLIETQPQVLAEDQRQTIEHKYTQEILVVQNEQYAARQKGEQALQELQQNASNGLAGVIDLQTSARQRLNGLEEQKHTLRQELGIYGQITFLQLLVTALAKVSPATLGKKLLSFLIIFAFLVLGILNLVIFITMVIMARA